MATQSLKNLKIDEAFSGICVIRRKELKKSQSGRHYLRLELGDASGRLFGHIWREPDNIFHAIDVGLFVKIDGKLRKFKNRKVLDINKIEIMKNSEGALDEALLPVSQKNIDLLKNEFMNHRASLQNTYLQELVELIFSDSLFFTDYLKLPSGKLWHHQYLYGNLEHMVSLLDLCDTMKKNYPNLNSDLIKAAVFFRNLGNSEVIDCHKFINYTTKGRLWGSTFIGAQRVMSGIRKISDFPKDLALHLLHLILSQSNGPYRNTEIPPMTREAIILSHIIALDIKANAVERIIHNDRIENSKWTSFNNMLNRFIYIAEPEMQVKETR
jgi:3'-5' exoribonuclease